MGKQTVVVILGNSMMMDGITVSLANNKTIRSIQIDPSTTNLNELLKSTEPDLIVFELGTAWSQSILSLLSEHPGMPLFGLDLEFSRVIVINSYQRFTKSIEELSQLFQDEVSAVLRI